MEFKGHVESTPEAHMTSGAHREQAGPPAYPGKHTQSCRLEDPDTDEEFSGHIDERFPPPQNEPAAHRVHDDPSAPVKPGGHLHCIRDEVPDADALWRGHEYCMLDEHQEFGGHCVQKDDELRRRRK